MTVSMRYYESIRHKYPEAVSKDQFYQIAHISKATALHLLQNGLVPCKDTGKKTRKSITHRIAGIRNGLVITIRVSPIGVN